MQRTSAYGAHFMVRDDARLWSGVGDCGHMIHVRWAPKAKALGGRMELVGC